MATGGRVLHHLKYRRAEPATTVLLAGFQAAETRGQRLRDGARTLRIHGQDVPVSATIESLDGLSTHATRNDVLRWLAGAPRPPRIAYVVHGEPEAARSLADAVRAELGWTVAIAEDGATVPLTSRP